MTAAPSAASDRRRLGDLSPRITRAGAITGAACLGVGLIVAMRSEYGWDHFFRAYLFGFMFVLAICLAALAFIMVQHATRAGWSVVVRRVAECIAGNLMWIWVAFIPLAAAALFGWTHIWHWMTPGIMEPSSPNYDELLAGKSAYLNVTFWLVRAAIFFVIWGLLARLYFRLSVEQDRTGDIGLTLRMQWWAPLGILAYFVTQTYAAVDWIMTLEAHWFSTMFGVYFFAASCCGFFATLALVLYGLQRKGKLENEVTPEHFQDVGKFLFAFGVVFWAYIGFSQYMLIWYGNIPEETNWFIVRQMGGWFWVSILLVVGHFAAPFLFLITKHTKRATGMLAIISAWMLAMVALDLYWLAMPTIPAAALQTVTSYDQLAALIEVGDVSVGFAPHLLDLLCLAGLVALATAATAHRMGTCTLIPERDPRLGESLAFENM